MLAAGRIGARRAASKGKILDAAHDPGGVGGWGLMDDQAANYKVLLLAAAALLVLVVFATLSLG